MSYADFQTRIAGVNDLLNVAGILIWDSRTMMPAAGAETRGHQIAAVMMQAREMLLADETKRLVDAAEKEKAGLPEDSPERRAIAQTRHAIAHHERIPARLQRRKAELKTVAESVWVEARANSDFKLFAPYLEEMVGIGREIADAIGYEGHPYDALVSIFEPGETAKSLGELFAELRAGLQPVVKAVTAATPPRADFLERDYPEDKQYAFALWAVDKIGYDLKRGRLDPTTHPFEISFTRNDVRITTRYYRNFISASLFGALHEAGHGIYEQGIDPAYTRTTLATDLVGLYAVGGVSFGAHESQSRLYENHIGRSRAFWNLHYGRLRDTFPDALKDVDVETFHRAVNRVRPGLIRVEADELTYDFHIMLRVDIEKALIDRSLKVADLPEFWNATIKKELGLDVPDHRRGVLQDIHWSSGHMGAFCNYTIGNVMAAQMLETARKEQPSLDATLVAGDYAPLLAWLGDKVHRHGRRYSRQDLIKRATGRGLDAKPYLTYLRTKYEDLYNVKV